MEENISGFKQRGDWITIVEHGERITAALDEIGVDNATYGDWDDWRPKSHEHLQTDITEKTAQEASIDEGPGERAGIAPDDDLRVAGENLVDAFEELTEDDLDDAIEKSEDSVTHVTRAADSAGRRALRAIEGTVYRQVMTQMSPCYFDTALISANLDRTRDANKPYVFEVNINDDELKQQVSDRLAKYETEITRWHVDTETNTENVEAAEGTEPPE